jgi:hypothetical protein
MALQTMLEDLKRAAWARTSPVSGQPNAWEFRRDCLGNLVRYSDFGNRHSPFGWELDVITRLAAAGQGPDNVQALHWKATAARGAHQELGLRLQTVAESEAARRR